MRKTFLVLILLLLVSAAHAQNPPPPTPLMLLINGDYYAWNEGSAAAPERLTTSGQNFEPALSPDGRTMAYMQYAPITIDALERSGGIGGGQLPGDIAVLDIANRQEILIAGQPADASFFVEGVPDNAIMRSTPVWSPDGNRLAWTELDYPITAGGRLVTYDFISGTTQLIAVNLPEQGGVPGPMRVLWSSSGLVVVSYTPTTRAGTYAEDVAFLVFDDDTGEPLATIPVPQTDASLVLDYLLVDYEGRQYLGGLYNSATWILFDPASGSAVPAPGLLELVPAALTAAPYSALLFPPAAGEAGRFDLTDAAGDPAGLTIPLNTALTPPRVAFSPDGAAIAYIGADNQTVVVSRAGEPEVFVQPVGENQYVSALVWSPLAWRIFTGETEVMTSPTFNCPDALPPRLTLGSTGRVLPGGGPNNVRSDPFTTAAIVGEIPENADFTVQRGPDCGGDIVWWEVEYQGLTGWTAESQGENYFVEPVP